MLWIKAFHIMAMVLWFSGLFYLPRLFVYHAMQQDDETNKRFEIMEKSLYLYVTTPGALLTFLFGILLLHFNFASGLYPRWLWIKLVCVFLLLIYHIYLGFLLYQFSKHQNKHSAGFFRWINELPTLFLVCIVLLAILKPA